MHGSSPVIGRPSWRPELKAILRLTMPLAAAQLAQMLMGITDAVMMGRISTDALAAGGLGGNVAFMMIIMAQGLVVSIQPIVAQARGAGEQSGFGRILLGGLVVATVAAVPIILAITHIDLLLDAVGEPHQIATMTLEYELAFAWGIPVALWQGAFRSYLSAMERPGIIMIVASVACVANLFLNWVLIFGHLGLPALGLKGSGYATAIVWWGMGAAFVLYTWRARLLPSDFFQMTLVEFGHGLRAMLKLGWPISGIYAVEIGLFSASSLLMGRFGPVALAAHQICLGLASLTFMVPLGISQAATVRVGFHVGAGAIERARIAGLTALGLGIGFMSIMAVSLWALGRPIFYLYLNATDPKLDAVLALGSELLAVAAVFQVFDGAQVVAAGALRGLKDTRASLLAAVIGYWCLGMPIGAGLAFGLGMGPVGLWWGFVGGLVAVSILLSLRFLHRTDRMIAAAQLPAWS
jgi:MATE family multidrug resistance protein